MHHAPPLKAEREREGGGGEKVRSSKGNGCRSGVKSSSDSFLFYLHFSCSHCDHKLLKFQFLIPRSFRRTPPSPPPPMTTCI